MGDHWVEVSVVVQARVSLLQTIGPDDHINRLPHGDAARAEGAMVRGCYLRLSDIQHGYDRELDESSAKLRSVGVITSAPKNFQDHNIADKQLIAAIIVESAQFPYRLIVKTPEEANPDRTIGDNHPGRLKSRPWRICP